MVMSAGKEECINNKAFQDKQAWEYFSASAMTA
jgi:hypothetical protein